MKINEKRRKAGYIEQAPYIDDHGVHVIEFGSLSERTARYHLREASSELQSPDNADVASAHALTAIGHLLAEILDRLPQR